MGDGDREGRKTVIDKDPPPHPPFDGSSYRAAGTALAGYPGKYLGTYLGRQLVIYPTWVILIIPHALSTSRAPCRPRPNPSSSICRLPSSHSQVSELPPSWVYPACQSWPLESLWPHRTCQE